MLGKIPRFVQIDFCNSYRCVLLYRIVFSISEGHQQAFTCSKFTRKTPEQCVVILKLAIRIPERTSMTLFWYLYC